MMPRGGTVASSLPEYNQNLSLRPSKVHCCRARAHKTAPRGKDEARTGEPAPPAVAAPTNFASKYDHAGDVVGLVLSHVLRVFQLVRRGRPRRDAARLAGFDRRRHQVALQLRRQDRTPPPRRQAALRRRPHPRARRAALALLPRSVPEAPGAVRLGRGERAVPAADGGHGRARLSDGRRRPRQRAGRVRRGGGEAGNAAAAAQDPGIPLRAHAGEEGQDDASFATHSAAGQSSPTGPPPYAREPCLVALRRGDPACALLSGQARALLPLPMTRHRIIIIGAGGGGGCVPA